MNAKQAAAEAAVALVTHGMTIGLGTGSTTEWALRKIGEKVKMGLEVTAFCSSLATEKRARELHIPLGDFSTISSIDVTIDGADEVDPKGFLIKGGGGALMREKLLAAHSDKFLVIVDDSKCVDALGRYPLPVEILSFGAELTLAALEEIGVKVSLRKKDKVVYATDNGNFIADCACFPIPDPAALHQKIKLIPGVLETGIFPAEMVHSIYVGYEDGTVKVRKGAAC